MQFRRLIVTVILVMLSATTIVYPYAQDTTDTTGMATIQALNEALQDGDMDTFMQYFSSRVAFMAKDLEKEGGRIGSTDEIRAIFEDLIQDYDLSLSVIGMSEDGQLWLVDMQMDSENLSEIGLGPMYIPLEFSMRNGQVMRLHWLLSNHSRDLIRDTMVMPPVTLADIQGTIEGVMANFRVDFNDDGTYHIYGVNMAIAAPQDYGTYTFDGNRITLISNEESSQCSPGSKVTWTLAWQKDYTLGIILESVNDETCPNRQVPPGDIHRFKKVTDGEES